MLPQYSCHDFEFAMSYRPLPSFVNDPLTLEAGIEQNKYSAETKPAFVHAELSG
jgi:hypothetical protein